jgi:hypothetical protein
MAALPRCARSPCAGSHAPGEEVVALLTAYRPLSWSNRVSTSVVGAGRVTGRYGITPAATGAVHRALPFAYTACLTPGGWRIGRQGARPSPALLGPGGVRARGSPIAPSLASARAHGVELLGARLTVAVSAHTPGPACVPYPGTRRAPLLPRR